MKKINFKDYLPHLIAIAIFLLVSIIYCLPLFQGMVVNQHDMIGTKGMTQQSIEFYEKYGHYPLWTNSMFSGMPTYQVLFAAKYNVGIGWLHSLFTGFLPSTAGLFFLSCICFYILTQALKLKPWIGIFGSLAYAFASYNAIIAVVGHVTKFATMGYAPAVLAGLILLTEKKYVLGFALMLIFSTLFFTQNHVQMVYYFMMVLACLAVAFFVRTIQTKDYKHFLKAGSLALLAIILAAASFAVILLPTNQYAKETMRGGRSELTLDKKTAKDNKSAGGLDKDYAFGWSYGKAETFTILLPNFMGSDNGGPERDDPDPSAGRFGDHDKWVEKLSDAKLSDNFYNYLLQLRYWGNQPGTSGPVYLGIFVCMLSVAGLFFIPKKYLSWLLAATIIGIILSWGRNFASINNFLFDHVPGMNKFRSVSSALVIPQLTLAIMATLTLQQLFYGTMDKDRLYKKLKLSAVACAALLLIVTAFYFMSSFKSDNDKELKANLVEQLSQSQQGAPPTPDIMQNATATATSFLNVVDNYRKSLYGSDLLRLYLYLIAGIAVLWLGIKGKIKPLLAISLITVLSFIDLVTVDARYLNKTHYTTPDDYVAGLTATPADLLIKKDTSYFRVFDRSGGDPFQDSRASYFHNSIGGYSPAKLGLYEDLKKYQLQKNGTSAFNIEVLNMLNTKYVIDRNPQDGRYMASPNPQANGPVWFVKGIKYVNNANEEMLALDSLHSMDTVVIDKREQSKVTGSIQYDSAAKIALVRNRNDEIIYQSKAAGSQFAVFSEIYYPHGWKAYIDEKETPIVKVDYAFRGLNIPAGNHTIRFEFKPAVYETANMISLLAGIITIVLLLLCAFLLYKENHKSA